MTKNKKARELIFYLVTLLAFILIACVFLYLLGRSEENLYPSVSEEFPDAEELEFTMNLTSPAFAYGEAIPIKYSCNGENISPPLAWDEPPAGTQTFALIMDDPDAPLSNWDHWVVFHIPADVRSLPEDMPRGMRFEDVAALFGKNSWGENAYGGPCPLSGTHRYFFKLYALNIVLDLQENVEKSGLLAAMQGHILAQAELMGTFSK